ncbi:MAG TPA: DUF5658 family protein [bacterium]|jgi:hypothetical protein
MKEKNPEMPVEGHVPPFKNFVVLLASLWALNLADTFQTLFLKDSGFLHKEANFFIDFFLTKGSVQFISAKVLAMVVVSIILVRGWRDKDGFSFLGTRYNSVQVKKSIYFLLTAGVIYYILIVIFPFIVLSLTGLLEPVG